MDENKSCIAEVHHYLQERKGVVLTEEDEQHICDMLKVSNDDISIEDVEFKRHRSYF